MRRSNNDYERMAQPIMDIYLDYNLHGFPIDEHKVCQKLGILLIPYSEFPLEKISLLKKKSKDAFYVPATKKHPHMILYNDNMNDVKSIGRMRYSIFHELKHYINNDKTETQFGEDMADFFSRYFMCPIPYLIAKNYPPDFFMIANDFNISIDAAKNVASNLKNRIKAYGNKIFDNEKEFVNHLLETDTYLDSNNNNKKALLCNKTSTVLIE